MDSGDKNAVERASTPFNRAVDELIDSLNRKRLRDAELLVELRKTLEKQVDEIMYTVEFMMKKVHDQHDAEDSALITELDKILTEIDGFEAELTGFKEALRCFYQELSCRQYSQHIDPPTK